MAGKDMSPNEVVAADTIAALYGGVKQQIDGKGATDGRATGSSTCQMARRSCSKPPGHATRS